MAERRQRSTEIITVLAKYGLAENLSGELIASLEKVLRDRLMVSDPAAAGMSAGERIRAALTELGQLEFAVTTQAEGVTAEIVESELGAPLHELFRDFDPVARASASAAQVHEATLHNGTEVVVKVVHQGADVRATEDVEIMTALTQRWEHNDPRAKQFRLVQRRPGHAHRAGQHESVGPGAGAPSGGVRSGAVPHTQQPPRADYATLIRTRETSS